MNRYWIISNQIFKLFADNFLLKNCLQSKAKTNTIFPFLFCFVQFLKLRRNQKQIFYRQNSSFLETRWLITFHCSLLNFSWWSLFRYEQQLHQKWTKGKGAKHMIVRHEASTRCNCKRGNSKKRQNAMAWLRWDSGVRASNQKWTHFTRCAAPSSSSCSGSRTY